MNKTTTFLIPALCIGLAGCQVGLEDEEVGTTTAHLETLAQSQVDNAFNWAANSGASNCGSGFNQAANMCGPINGRQVSWKSNGWTSSSSGQASVCTYGWCGWFPIGNCSRSSGDDDEGYSYGACNSTAFGERFAGFLWKAGQKASYKTKVSGTTTFGYHPYWCFKYGTSVRTYQGWSYTNSCGGSYDFLVASAAPPPAVCGNGVQESGEQCDLGANNGNLGYCCSTDCKYQSAGSVCRGTTGICDVEEKCSGSSATCPNNTYQPSSKLCRAQVGDCDVAENCDGTHPSCPTDMVRASGSCTTQDGDAGYCTSSGGTGTGICQANGIPAAWICQEEWYNDGQYCDCGCEAADPDCSNSSTTVRQFCPGGEECTRNQTICHSTGNNVPSGWNTSLCPLSYIGDDYCDCGCGGHDPDCDALGKKLYQNGCGSTKACSWGESKCHDGDYEWRNGSSRAGNCPASYETDSSCDVGCQFQDPKCGGPW